MTHPSGSDIEARVGRKVIWRLVIPAALYILVGAIDRANVGFAALEMNKALGLSGADYGFGAGVLFVGYMLAKYPSVLLYERLGVRGWLGLITFAWGLAAMGMAFIETPWQLYALRVAIGFAEGGLSSGLMIYLSNWAAERYRASVLAIPIMSVSIAQVIGAPVSGWLIDAPNPLGWEGWRWMFLVEGFPAVVLALVAVLYFPNTPRDARWLTAEERSWTEANVKGAATRKGDSALTKWSALGNPIAWLCAIIWFCLLAGNYGVMFWLPTIVKGMSGLTSAEVGLVVALPWMGSALGLLFNAWHSDRTQERYLHIAVPLGVAACGLVSAFLLGPGLPGLAALIVGHACLGSTVAPFWAIPTRLLPPAALARGIIVINMVGSFAGFTMPTLMGHLRDTTGSYLPPTLLLCAVLAAGAALCLLARALAPGYAARAAAAASAS